MKEASVYIDSPLLLADLAAQRDHRDSLLSELDTLQARRLCSFIIISLHRRVHLVDIGILFACLVLACVCIMTVCV